MTEKLKPCPFCGSTEVYVEEYEHHPGAMRWRVLCAGCMAGIDTGIWQSAGSAVQDWNRRAERTCSLPIVRDDEECERQAGVGVFVAQEIPLCRKCTSCGRQYAPVARLPEGLRYCPYCGARVIGEETGNAD